MKAFFEQRKSELSACLRAYLNEHSCHSIEVKPFGRDICDEIAIFCERGKMIRGGLVCLGHQLSGRDATADALNAGVALELMHSALLIHDDLMDRDLRRRGGDSFNQRFRSLAEAQKLKDPAHIGDGMALCAGDIAFFLALRLLGLLSCGPETRARIRELVTLEMIVVGTAQMADLYLGASEDAFDEKTVFDLYRHKTGRYTFSLPLMTGMLLGNMGESERDAVGRIGEHLGIVFQIKDDELGLFGNEEETGKPVGSDIRQGKKTPFVLCLLKRVDPRTRSGLDRILGNPRATLEEVVYVRDLVSGLGIREEIHAMVDALSREAMSMVEAIDIPNRDARRILAELIDYNSGRTR